MKWIPIILVVVLLCGCNNAIFNPEMNKFVGTWTRGSGFTQSSLTFFSDGTGSQSSISITWEIKDEKLVINFMEVRAVYTYIFLDGDNSLRLTDTASGYSAIYTKN